MSFTTVQISMKSYRPVLFQKLRRHSVSAVAQAKSRSDPSHNNLKITTLRSYSTSIRSTSEHLRKLTECNVFEMNTPPLSFYIFNLLPSFNPEYLNIFRFGRVIAIEYRCYEHDAIMYQPQATTYQID